MTNTFCIKCKRMCLRCTCDMTHLFECNVFCMKHQIVCFRCVPAKEQKRRDEIAVIRTCIEAQCDTVFCSMLQCAAVCCSVLQRVALTLSEGVETRSLPCHLVLTRCQDLSAKEPYVSKKEPGISAKEAYLCEGAHRLSLSL